MMIGSKNEAGAAERLSWQGLVYAASPALLYTVLTNIFHSIFAGLFAGVFDSGIVMQAVSVFLCLLLFGWYARKEHLRIRSRKKGVYRYPASFCYVVAVVMCSVVNNYLFSIIRSAIGEFSSNYWHVAQVFYRNDLWMEILTLCVLGPLAEELIYRGFVYQRLRRSSSEMVAAVGSALLFGVMHFNLVQCLHAFILGILLAHIVYKTGSLLVAAAAHMVANFASVLWTETDWLDFLNQNGSRQYVAALLCLVLMTIFLSYGNQLMRHEK